jgi:hypothetical protein
MKLSVALGVVSILLATQARAEDRPVTAEERVQLVAALQAQGCTGGKMEFDDGKFEVDNAKCSDGRTYDLDFDASFKLLKKDLED